MEYFAGVDIGSTSIKIVLIDEQKTVVGDITTLTNGSFHANTVFAYQQLLIQTGIKEPAVRRIVSTGYGRKLFGEANETISEITANAAGVRALSESVGEVRTIINIGGQDLKIIALDSAGYCHDFIMNDKCAAGTGRFLEMVSRSLNIPLEELGNVHLQLNGVPVTINSTCTVFAESEIISLLAAGHGHAEIVAGIHYSIARRISRLCKRLDSIDAVLFDGGPALNLGLAEAISDELMCDIRIPDQPQITTALGAALIGLETETGKKEIKYA
ncbi:CoA activase [bacterium]|nr:CoA activase [bacterium]